MNLQDSCPVLLSFETSFDTFQKTSQFLYVFFGDQFYPAIILNYLHLLSWTKIQVFSNCLRKNHLNLR